MTRRIAEAWLAARMLGWLLLLPGLKRVMPLPSLVRLMSVTPARRRAVSPAEIERMSSMARWLALHTWPHRSGTCLEQSLILYRFLSARSVPPELVIGVRRHDETVGAHAWITVNGRAIGHSAAALAEFSPMLAFGPAGVARTPSR